MKNGVAIYGGFVGSETALNQRNCLFLANQASFGGAMFNYGAFSGTSSPVMTNCVLFGNGDSNTFFTNTATATATYSLFDNTVTGVITSGPVSVSGSSTWSPSR